MRRYLKRILTILDGAPEPTQPQAAMRRGQSLVEITLVMPILLIMFLGLVEIGWLANNFLVLLDVSRGAARFGATTDPLEWVSPNEHYLERMDCNEFPGASTVDLDGNVTLPISDTSHLPAVFETGSEGPIGYFDGVACAAIQNMTPMVFNTATDDIVVSVFSYISGDFGSGYELRVTGRFPARQNECSNESFDPFDFNHNGSCDPGVEDCGPSSAGRMYDGYEELNPADNDENIRGYVLTGHHQVSDAPGCIGSEFSTAEMETLLNGASALENENTPNNGLLLVEVFWHHKQLLGLPWFTIIGNDFELHVWSMYPVTAAEPTATSP